VVGSDKKFRLEDLPAGFRGLTRFRYRITDAGGAFAVATAAVFIGTDPFRAVFAGETGTAGVPEVYMTDFVSPPWRATLATEGNLRLRGFVTSDNGATIVYRRENSSSTDLSFVRTTTSDSTADQQVRITLPAGYSPIADASGADQFAVSPDGQWIATIARTSSQNEYAVFAVNVAAPTTVRNVTPDGTRYASRPEFSANSGRLYFLASQTNADNNGVARRSLYRLELGATSDAPVQLSRVYNGMNPGDITAFSVASNEARIALDATRNGKRNVYFIDPANAGTEVQINHALSAVETLTGSTVGLKPGRGGLAGLERIGYTARNFFTSSAYVAEVNATPNPRVVAGSNAVAVGFRSDGDAMLYSRTTQIHEAVIDSTAPQDLVGFGSFGVHDSTGETIVLQQANTLSAARRGSFGSPAAIGTPGQSAWFTDFSGAPRAIVLIGEGPAGAAPRTIRLSLVNARAPDKLLPVADFNTPIDLTSGEARLVTY
jgi:hypothetical protein